ncbi:hypothetical protein FisN_22Lh068 [Fistulifera solaris]|uniref:Uncharacterized protein n=1 Tax=Fistulifera solaris TaxID=1519565 RepID=A0A1Z5JBL6_FISSO|nr:hypothetical protein FisN_22Lh068 [Fistulifera solaris]|eukprot:GAX11394.1 hypothetical protein FisN_22Lh068 [Fistulifera solaris]
MFSAVFKTFFPILLAVAAFGCSALFTFYCESVQIKPMNDSSLPTVEFSLFTEKQYYVEEFPNNNYRTKVGCFYHDDLNYDAEWKTARAFGCLTLLIGGFAILAAIFGSLCHRLSQTSWNQLAGLYMVILPLFQGLTFFMLRSELCSNNSPIFREGDYGSCQWNSGATANVFGIVLWFLAGATMLISGAPVRDRRPPPETQEVTYERTHNPDGTVTVTQANVLKGTAVRATDMEEQRVD